MLLGSWSQGLSQSCIRAISTVTPPSVCTNKAETTLRTKGGGVSFCALPVGPTEPTEAAPLLDPTAKNGSVMSAHLLPPWAGLEGWSSVTYLKTRVTSPAAAGPCIPRSFSSGPPTWKRIGALPALSGSSHPCEKSPSPLVAEATPGDPKESEPLRTAKSPSHSFRVVAAKGSGVRNSAAASVWRWHFEIMRLGGPAVR